MKDKICKFAKICKGYRPEHYSCGHQSEAEWYCGYYRQHKAAVLRIEMKGMLKGTDLAGAGFAE